MFRFTDIILTFFSRKKKFFSLELWALWLGNTREIFCRFNFVGFCKFSFSSSLFLFFTLLHFLRDSCPLWVYCQQHLDGFPPISYMYVAIGREGGCNFVDVVTVGACCIKRNQQRRLQLATSQLFLWRFWVAGVAPECVNEDLATVILAADSYPSANEKLAAGDFWLPPVSFRTLCIPFSSSSLQTRDLLRRYSKATITHLEEIYR